MIIVSINSNWWCFNLPYWL